MLVIHSYPEKDCFINQFMSVLGRVGLLKHQRPEETPAQSHDLSMGLPWAAQPEPVALLCRLIYGPDTTSYIAWISPVTTFYWVLTYCKCFMISHLIGSLQEITQWERFCKLKTTNPALWGDTPDSTLSAGGNRARFWNQICFWKPISQGLWELPSSAFQ